VDVHLTQDWHAEYHVCAMRKTEWVSAAVTLVATGLGYFISGPKAAAVCIVIGTIAVIVLHLGGHKNKDEDAAAKLSIKGSFNPQQRQEFNPVFAPKIEISQIPS
jgi:hypothetical protein